MGGRQRIRIGRVEFGAALPPREQHRVELQVAEELVPVGQGAARSAVGVVEIRLGVEPLVVVDARRSDEVDGALPVAYQRRRVGPLARGFVDIAAHEQEDEDVLGERSLELRRQLLDERRRGGTDDEVGRCGEQVTKGRQRRSPVLEISIVLLAHRLHVGRGRRIPVGRSSARTD